MENKQMGIQKHGVKCDTKECGFSVTLEDFNQYDQFINHPCPNCGANLLTQEDYDMVHMIQRLSTDEEFAEEFIKANPTPELPPEIQAMLAQLEEPDKAMAVRVEFVDGIPVMSSTDPKVQEIIDSIEKFIKGQMGSLEQNNQEG